MTEQPLPVPLESLEPLLRRVELAACQQALRELREQLMPPASE